MKKAALKDRILPKIKCLVWRFRCLVYPQLGKFDFMILGGMKCASTSLAEFLKEHPSCIMTKRKETHLFTRYYKTIYFYMQFFLQLPEKQKSLKDKLLFEASTEYSFYDEVPKRLYLHNPHLKLILLVRDPVARAFSQYQMHYDYACKKHTFWEKIDEQYMVKMLDFENYPFSWFVEEEFRLMEETGSLLPSAFMYPDFLRRGLYSEQIDRYYRYFKPEQLLVLVDTDLKYHKKETLRKVETFLDIPHFDWPESALENKNIGDYKFTIPIDFKAQMRIFFAPWNEKLYEKIGRRLDW